MAHPEVCDADEPRSPSHSACYEHQDTWMLQQGPKDNPNSLLKKSRETLVWDRPWLGDPVPACLPGLLSARWHLVPLESGFAVTCATDEKTEA